MTRKTIIRTLAALFALSAGDASLYWHLLPKREKRCRYWNQPYHRRAMNAVAVAHGRRAIARLFSDRRWDFSFIKIETATPITEREFRLPFFVKSGPFVSPWEKTA